VWLSFNSDFTFDIHNISSSLPISPGPLYTGGLDLADMDNDGCNDIIWANGLSYGVFYQVKDEGVCVGDFELDSLTTMPTSHFIREITVIDSGNTLLNLLVSMGVPGSTTTMRIDFLEQENEGSFVTHTIMDEAGSDAPPDDLVIADINNDGENDILMSMCSSLYFLLICL